MSNNQKVKNNILLNKISKDIDTIKDDILLIKNYIKVMKDSEGIIHIQKPAEKPPDENIYTGWRIF